MEANSGNSIIRLLSFVFIGLGALTLMAVPILLLVLALGQANDADVSGFLVIGSAVVGMAFAVIGAALHD